MSENWLARTRRESKPQSPLKIRVSQLNRQLPNSSPGRGEDGIGYGRCHRRQGTLTEPAGRIVALNEVNVDSWNIFHATESVVVKVALLHDAIFHSNLPV